MKYELIIDKRINCHTSDGKIPGSGTPGIQDS
jgi:hypothetical protein